VDVQKMSTSQDRVPKLLILGPIFNTPSGPGGQGGALYTKLSQRGYPVLRVSHYRNKILRMVHTLFVVCFRNSAYDIILLQSFGLLAFVMEDVVSFLAGWMRKPVVFTLNGGAFFEFYQRYPSWVRRVLGRASTITTPSHFLAEQFQAEGIEVKYMPNAIDLTHFPFGRNTERSHSLLWVRAFHNIYHPELAIETVRLLKEGFPDIKLSMIGPDQGLLNSCRQMIKEYKLEDHIDILGYISNKELYRYYQSHQVYLNTTRYESFGVALMEAGACGIPCVSVKVGEIPFLWKDEQNVLFAEREATDFAAKIKELIISTDKRETLSRNARNNAEEYTWEKILPQWEHLIKLQTQAQ